ncbi:unnamed protein product [Fraxinus pennsylvanica]|uniref:Uncharacterized protein n=1 Tax=Fraxinus pennsylvanica TaxID=56036 RepID=A0AAD2E1V0_9LAMI|nr:unnamed protein product [Fraxinus pennsylvanica]
MCIWPLSGVPGTNKGSAQAQNLRDSLSEVKSDIVVKVICCLFLLADQIGDPKYKWPCKDNEDKDFSYCLIPHEKSNVEINEELEISDGSCEDDSPGVFLNPNQSTAPQQSFWKLIKSNMFLHRSRKSQTIDEWILVVNLLNFLVSMKMTEATQMEPMYQSGIDVFKSKCCNANNYPPSDTAILSENNLKIKSTVHTASTGYFVVLLILGGSKVAAMWLLLTR